MSHHEQLGNIHKMKSFYRRMYVTVLALILVIVVLILILERLGSTTQLRPSLLISLLVSFAGSLATLLVFAHLYLWLRPPPCEIPEECRLNEIHDNVVATSALLDKEVSTLKSDREKLESVSQMTEELCAKLGGVLTTHKGLKVKLAEIADDCFDFSYVGHHGKYTRRHTLPRLAHCLQRDDSHRNVLMIILDPSDENVLSLDIGNETFWNDLGVYDMTPQNKKNPKRRHIVEILTTIVIVYFLSPKLKVEVGLSQSASLFRIDLYHERLAVVSQAGRTSSVLMFEYQGAGHGRHSIAASAGYNSYLREVVVRQNQCSARLTQSTNVKTAIRLKDYATDTWSQHVSPIETFLQELLGDARMNSIQEIYKGSGYEDSESLYVEIARNVHEDLNNFNIL